MKLKGSEVKLLQRAILDSYNRDTLRQVVRICLDEDFDELVTEAPLANQVYELIQWAERKSCIWQLVQCVYENNPTNVQLGSVYSVLIARRDTSVTSYEEQPGTTKHSWLSSKITMSLTSIAVITTVLLLGSNLNQHFAKWSQPEAGGEKVDTFNESALKSFPSGWRLLGSAQFTPLIVDQNGKNSPVFEFPEVEWQYWDSIAIRTDIVNVDQFLVEVKMRFLSDVADRAGLTIALNTSTLERIDIQANVYNDEIEFRSSYSGQIHTLTPIEPIEPHIDYWLRAIATAKGVSQNQVDVYWSTDGVTFIKVLEVTELEQLSGGIGVSTAGPHMPHVQFDDFRWHTNLD